MNEVEKYSPYELLLKVSEGDEDAFNWLYERNWRMIYSYIEPIVKSSETTEEIVADIFLKLWQLRARVKEIENIQAYLRTAARNKALDFIKVTARQKLKEQLYRTEIAFRTQNSPHDQLLDKEILKIVQSCVDQLSPQRKKIFLMHREEGLSYQEIADQLNLSPTTVKKTVFDAIASMREFLRNHHADLEILILYLSIYTLI